MARVEALCTSAAKGDRNRPAADHAVRMTP